MTHPPTQQPPELFLCKYAANSLKVTYGGFSDRKEKKRGRVGGWGLGNIPASVAQGSLVVMQRVSAS